MSDRVLVTGATGFVGRHLVSALQTEGHEIVAHSHRNGDIARCDLSYDGIQYVFHLAARTFVPESWQITRDFYETNVLGAVNVLEFCRRHACPLALVSSYVYGRPRYLPIDENHPVEGFNPYAHAKILAEEAAAFYAKQFELQIAVVRPFNLYGAGLNPNFLIPTLINQAVGPGDTITVADPRPKRDYIHVRDLVSLLLLLAKYRATGTYNAGSGVSTGIGELVELMNESLASRKRVVSSEQLRENEVLDTVADCSKAASAFGWRTQTKLADGIRELVQEAQRTQSGAAVL